jgi:hypothetical protein
MKYTVLFKLSGALADAVAVEWTDQDAPGADGAGWQPCMRIEEGTWQMSSRDPEAALHWREPGPFENIALRYRLSSTGPWSSASADRKAITIVAHSEEPDEPTLPVPPVLLASPALVGSGIIGTEVSVDSGLWSGDPAPALSLVWLRDGAEIAGATEAVYVPSPEDDRTELACAVTASNTAGSERVVTAAFSVKYAPPTLTGTLTEEDIFILDEDTGPQIVEAAPGFAGEALSYSVEGAGATVDAATGVISIPTETPADGETVTVSAANSGGSIATSFRVTVEAFEGEEGTFEIGPANSELLVASDLDPEQTGLHIGLRILDSEHPLHPACGGLGCVAWTGADATGRDPVLGSNKAVRAKGFADPASPGYGVWALTRESNGGTASWADRSTEIGNEFQITINWAPEDSASTPFENATWLGWGAPFPSFLLTRPDGGLEQPLPSPVPTSGSKRMMMRTEGEYRAYLESGYIGGDGLQLMTGSDQCIAHPEVIVIAQDVDMPWLSLDKGKSWWKPVCTGLQSALTNGIGIDPQDPARWIVITQNSFDDSPFPGIFMTTDFGVNWDYKLRLDGIGERVAQWGIVGARGSIQNGRAQRWYIIAQRDKNASQNHYFCRSTDGGKTVQIVDANMSGSQFGRIQGIASHPTNPDTFFLATSTGIWRCANGGSGSPSFTRLSGSGSLPGGNYKTLPYCEMVNGKCRIIVGQGQGVYRCDDADAGSPSWTRVSSKPCDYLFVSRWEPDFMVNCDSESATQRSTNGGSSWSNVPISQYQCRPDGNSPKHPRYPSMYFFPDQSGHAFVRGEAGGYDVGCWFRTANYGASWQISMDYFSGNHCSQYMGNGMLFHPTNADIWGLPTIDSGIVHTENRGRSFNRSSLQPRQIFTQGQPRHPSTHAGAMHPNFSKRPTLIGAFNRHTKGSLAANTDGNKGDWYEPGPTSIETAPFIGYDYDDPRYAYWWRHKSTNHGESNWSQMGSLPGDYVVWGMTRYDRNLANGQAIFALNEGGGLDMVQRSTNRGSGWDLVLDMGAHNLRDGEGVSNIPSGNARWDLGDPGSKGGAFLPHPADHNVLYTRGPKYAAGSLSGTTTYECWHIIRWRLNSGSANNRPFSVIEVPKSLRDQMTPGSRFYIKAIAVDPRHPDDVFYIVNLYPGTGLGLLRYAFGVWDNLTHLVGEGRRTWLDVSPVTGDLITGCPHGMFVIPPPYEQAGTIYEALEQPGRILLSPPL